MRYPFLLLALTAFLPLHAIIEKRMDEKNPYAVTLSRHSHSRISVENSIIEKVFGSGEIFSINLDATTGQAFISIHQDIKDTPEALTIVTSGGYVQDLHVTSADIASEHILLKEPLEEETTLKPLDLHSDTLEFLNSIIEGETPFGYGKRPFRDSDHLNLPRPLKATPVQAYDGPFETVVTYRLTNTGKRPITIKTDALKRDTDLWVFLSANEMPASGHITCIVATPKQEERR